MNGQRSAIRLAIGALGAFFSLLLGQGFGQRPASAPAPGQTVAAQVETLALELSSPDRYQVPTILQPDRLVEVMATEDGIVQALPSRVGQVVRDRQEVAILDRSEALSRLKIAKAELQEQQAVASAAKDPAQKLIAQAQVEAAVGRVELEQLRIDRCSLKAPFAGLLLDYQVSEGQYVPKGTILARLADVSRLKVLMPVGRGSVEPGKTMELSIDGKLVTGNVQAVLPLPEEYAALRELATSWSAALVVVENPEVLGLQAGQRVRSPLVPDALIGVVPARALKRGGDPTSAELQVIRNEHVTSVPVRLLGELGPDRVQVTGALRSGDVAVVASSVPLADGSFISFGGDGNRSLQLLAPDPSARGTAAQVVVPGTNSPAAATSVAPIGRPDSALPGASGRPGATRPSAPATRPGSVPF